MKRIAVVLVLFLLVIQSIIAQTQKSDSIYLTGAVMDGKKQTALPYAGIQINHKKTGNADVYGKFAFRVNVGDTINYSFVGYRDLRIVVSDSLKQKAYLFGVFMTRDTIALDEVVILPRFGNFKAAFIRANPNTPEYVRATNNINSATYQALTTTLTPETKMDAKDNTDMLIQESVIKTEYKAMGHTDMMLDISTIRTMPELRRIKRKRKLKIPNNMVTDKEIKLLKRMSRVWKK